MNLHKNPVPTKRLPAVRWFCPVMLLMFTCTHWGCGNDSAVVIIRPQNQLNKPLSLSFPLAFFGKDAAGEDEIILLRDPIDDSSSTSAGKPLAPATSPPLRQVLIIQMHWRIALADNADSPVADNAVLHFYVYGDPLNAGRGLVHYVGSGSISFHPDGPSASVTIHNALLKRADQQGSLSDPFGSFQVSGSFSANADAPKLLQTLTDIANETKDAASTQPR